MVLAKKLLTERNASGSSNKAFFEKDYGEESRKMGKTHEDNKAQKLTRLLKRLNQGTDPQGLQREASKLIENITTRDIAQAEQNLINTGFTAKLAGQLSSVFVLMGILEDQNKLRDKLPINHIVRKILAEHDMLRCFLADFSDTVDKMLEMNALADTNSEFMKLTHIVEHLNAMEEHIEREEDIVFPYLKKFGWDNLCRSSHNDHVYIKIAINDLVNLVGTYTPRRFGDFKVRIKSINKYLCTTMAEHLFQEDNILYPIALKVIDDDKVWEEMKTVCEEIGYCGVHT